MISNRNSNDSTKGRITENLHGLPWHSFRNVALVWFGVNDFTYQLFMMAVAAMLVISVAVMVSMSVMIASDSFLYGDFSVY